MNWLARTPDPVLPDITEHELAIASALADMAIARGGLLDDFQTPVYLRALVDLDPALIARACEAIGLERREDFEPVLPPVGTIRARVEQMAQEDAATAAAAKLLPPPVAEPDERPYFCLLCRDEPSAWRPYRCLGWGQAVAEESRDDERLTVLACARRTPHGSHTYVERCTCADVNPVIAAHKRRIAQHRAQQAPARRGRS